MLGMSGITVALGYVFSFLSLVVCMIYGIRHWNVGNITKKEELEEEVLWNLEEKKIEMDITGGDIK